MDINEVQRYVMTQINYRYSRAIRRSVAYQMEINELEIEPVMRHFVRISLKATITATGPTKAKLSRVVADLGGGPDGAFAVIELPGMRTSPGGTNYVVFEDIVKITDKRALANFVRELMCERGPIKLTLDNAVCGVSILNRKPEMTRFAKTIGLPQMCADMSIIFVTLQPDGEGIKLRVGIHNPSPVEMDLGVCHFEIRDTSPSSPSGSQQVWAELSGRIHLRRTGKKPWSYQSILLKGTRTALPAAAAADDDFFFYRAPGRGMALYGTCCTAAGWANHAIQGWRVELTDAQERVMVLAARSMLPRSPLPKSRFWKIFGDRDGVRVGRS